MLSLWTRNNVWVGKHGDDSGKKIEQLARKKVPLTPFLLLFGNFRCCERFMVQTISGRAQEWSGLLGRTTGQVPTFWG